MNKIGFALSILTILGVAAWAYSVNYRTQTALGRIEALRSQIAAEREALQVLRVEWAYLNAPGRLSALARRHHAALGLAPLDPARFDQVAAVPFPPADPADLAATVVAGATRPAPPAATLATVAPPAAAAQPTPARAKPATTKPATTKPTAAKPPAAAKPPKPQPARVEVAPARIAASPPAPAPVETESSAAPVETLSDRDLIGVLSQVADTIARSAATPASTDWTTGGRAND